MLIFYLTLGFGAIIGNWPLTENLLDYSSTGNTLTLHGPDPASYLTQGIDIYTPHYLDAPVKRAYVDLADITIQFTFYPRALGLYYLFCFGTAFAACDIQIDGELLSRNGGTLAVYRGSEMLARAGGTMSVDTQYAITVTVSAATGTATIYWSEMDTEERFYSIPIPRATYNSGILIGDASSTRFALSNLILSTTIENAENLSGSSSWIVWAVPLIVVFAVLALIWWWVR